MFDLFTACFLSCKPFFSSFRVCNMFAEYHSRIIKGNISFFSVFPDKLCPFCMKMDFISLEWIILALISLLVSMKNCEQANVAERQGMTTRIWFTKRLVERIQELLASHIIQTEFMLPSSLETRKKSTHLTSIWRH